MSAKRFTINFLGYWTKGDKSLIPSISGIYCIYSFSYKEGKFCGPSKLLYVGKADDDVKSRISNHEKLPDCQNLLSQGEQRCYSVGEIDSADGEIDSADRERCEAAIIFKHKPPVNTEYLNDFPFDQTTMSLKGKTDKLHTSFTVSPT